MTLSYLTLDAHRQLDCDLRRPADPRAQAHPQRAPVRSRTARRSFATAARALRSTTRATSRSTSGTRWPSPTSMGAERRAGDRPLPRVEPAGAPALAAGHRATAVARTETSRLSRQGIALGRHAPRRLHPARGRGRVDAERTGAEPIAMIAWKTASVFETEAGATLAAFGIVTHSSHGRRHASLLLQVVCARSSRSILTPNSTCQRTHSRGHA